MIERVAKLLHRCGDRASVMPPTELYNEGWLLRIALDWFGTDGASDSQFSFSSGAAWYSEGRLASRFLARSRSGKKAEGFTHADGTIGHFSVSPGERSEIVPTADATQLVVIEENLGSPLSSGTTNAPGYDQAARTAACLVHIASKAKVEPSSLTHYGFYVVAPEAQIKAGVFASLVTKESIEEKVRRRAVRFERGGSDGVDRQDLHAVLRSPEGRADFLGTDHRPDGCRFVRERVSPFLRNVLQLRPEASACNITYPLSAGGFAWWSRATLCVK